jgi:outer membrane protein assembly factor BamA
VPKFLRGRKSYFFVKIQLCKLFIFTKNWNWSWLLEPYLDTEYTAEDDEKITNLLIENGFPKQEISKIRNEIEEQMYKYNSILWEWID